MNFKRAVREEVVKLFVKRLFSLLESMWRLFSIQSLSVSNKDKPLFHNLEERQGKKEALHVREILKNVLFCDPVRSFQMGVFPMMNDSFLLEYFL